MQKTFPRSFDALGDIYVFTEQILAAASVTDSSRQTIHLAIEELFTNMVKYGRGADHDILLDVMAGDGAVTVSLTDFDADEFDVTADRGVDTSKPLDRRRPGGLGLHLVQKMVDSIEYDYHDRQSTIRFTKESG